MRGLGLGLGISRASLTTPALIAVPSPLSLVINSVTDFSAYVLNNMTVNDDAVSSYDGGGLRDQTRETAVTDAHSISETLATLGSGQQYQSDFVIKPDGRNFALFQIAGGGNNFYAIFDFETNVIGLNSGNLDSYAISDLSNGWKFVRVVFTAVDTAPYALNVYHATDGTTYTGIVGDIAKGLIIDRYVLSRN